MFPIDFLSAYGPVHSGVVVNDGNGTGQIPANPDRYLLVFWSTNGTTRITPMSPAQEVGSGFILNAASTPFIITHALHGAMVNAPYFMFFTAQDTFLVYMEGFMRRDDGPPRTVPIPVGMPQNTPRSVTQNLPPQLVIPPDELTPQSTTVLNLVSDDRRRVLISMSTKPLTNEQVYLYLLQGRRIEYEEGVGTWAVMV